MIIDTNILTRVFTGDDSVKAEAGRNFLHRLNAGDLQAVFPERHIIELVQVLTSPKLYNRSRDDVAAMLLTLFGISGLRIESGAVVREALQLFAEHRSIDFPDCLTAAEVAATNDVVLSYDRDFDRLGVRRQEP
ncbi:MAG TPA: PIN domain-containing protein [Chloroflexota bacterium]|nr:PIN domain-containing protein [Chloroflexota bacterium]